jgi:YD repeat-containing protein
MDRRSACNYSVKWTNLILLVISGLAVPLATAQVTSSQGGTAAMPDREQQNLRGTLKSCSEEQTIPGWADAEGKIYSEVHLESTWEYDIAGHLLNMRSRNSDGSQWVRHYDYDLSGRLLKTTSGVERQASTETNYSYDELGRLQEISGGGRTTTQLLFVTTSTEEKVRSRSLVQRTSVPESQKEDPRLRLQTGHRICRVEEARPQLTTNMTGPRKFRCVMPAGS